MADRRGGPLAGLKVVEMAGIGPGPFAAMMLADMGADVVRIDRLQPSGLGVERPVDFDFAARSRRSLGIDLKNPDGVACAMEMIARADVVIDPFRPGVMERIGLGPGPCLERNPRLVYGRLTGWGQEGPLSKAAGHDLNYIAITGVLDAIGRSDAPPTPPLNLVGDYAGGSMMLAFGVVCALLQARETGQGQVVDAAIVDGVSLLAAPLMGLKGAGLWPGGRGENLLDGGAPHYDVYACADGKYLSIAPIEGKFRKILLDGLGIAPEEMPDVSKRENWPAARRMIEEKVAAQPREHWCEIFEGSDACVAPVLSFEETITHPHNRARETFVEVGSTMQPAPAPRFSRSKPDTPVPPQPSGVGGAEALAEWGIDEKQIEEWSAAGVIAVRDDD